jgi:glycerophosphoryl diester phosphodiesterase
MTLAFGHRGARRLAPENTLESLQIAVLEGADGLEFDVQRTSDGELVLFHDDQCKRLTGLDAPFRSLAWRHIKTLRVHVKGMAPQPVPHFDDVLAWLAGRKLLVNAELKADAVALNAVQLAEAFARKTHGVDRARWLVSCFDVAPLERLHLGQLGLRLGGLVERIGGQWRGLLDPTSAPPFPLQAVHPEHALVTAERMRAWRQAGWQVAPWTVNAPRDWERLVLLGADAIITDDPGGLRRFLDRQGLP